MVTYSSCGNYENILKEECMKDYEQLIIIIYSIGINIITGIVFAKQVFKNMMMSIDEDTQIESISKPVQNEKPKSILAIKELSIADTILPQSKESRSFYNKIFFESRIILSLNIMLTSSLFILYFTSANITMILSSTGLLFLGFVIAIVISGIYEMFNRKKNKTLLVLRVFGSVRNSKFLFLRLVNFWNRIGTSFTIMDPAYAKMEFPIFFGTPRNFKLKFGQFVILIVASIISIPFHVLFTSNPESTFVKIVLWIIDTIILILISVVGFKILTRKIFLKRTQEVYDYVNKESNFNYKLNGLGKQINLYCYDNVWKKALKEMVERADVVLMDLRGFSEERKGCAFEIGYLMNHYSIRKVLFLVNSYTNIDFVKKTIEEEFLKITKDSPNFFPSDLEVNIYNCSRQNTNDIRQIMRILTNKLNPDMIDISLKDQKQIFGFFPLWASSFTFTGIYILFLLLLLISARS
jgi:hypothetical protein